MTIRGSALLFTGLVLALTACEDSSSAPTPSPATPATPTPAESAANAAAIAKAHEPSALFAQVRNGAVDEWLTDEPGFARYLGFHDADGKVPDLSKDGIQAHIGWLHREETALARVDPKGLSEDDLLDLAILKQHVDRALFDLVAMNAHHKSPQFYQDELGVNVYLDIEYAPLAIRANGLVEQEEASLKQIPHIKENLELPLSKPVAEVAARNAAGFATYLRTDVVKALKDVGDAAFKERFTKANEALATASDELAKWLKTTVIPTGDQSHVLGPMRYAKLLEVQEGLKMPLPEFKAIADKDLAENEASYQAVVKSAKATRPSAKTLLEVARTQVEESRAFVLEHKLLTLPFPDEKLLVRETPAYERWNLASIDTPGPFETERRAFYQITLPDAAWPKKEQDDYVPEYGTLLATTVHETYPGHFVQFQFVAKAPTKVQKMAGSYSFIEGWAHYTEQLMLAEEGFKKDDPQYRLGQAKDALLRDCRFLASIGIHTEGMTVEQATKLFEDKCHVDHASAREQATRGTFDPGYFAYTLGKLEILKLREEAKKKLGDKFSLQRFHDALLSHGSPPVALIHDRVLSEL